jgi:hypothetical protein
MKRILVLFLAALVLAACGASPAPTADAPTAAPVVPTAVPATAPPKATDAPTSTPAPTNTPKPTNTPRPTRTPAPPTPTPAPVALAGKGKVVTDPINPPAAINRVRFTHNGESNFIVKVYLADGSEDKILVNAIGKYTGQGLLLTDQPVYFEVNADGAWSMLVEEIYLDNAAQKGFSGTGDVVSDAFTPLRTGPVPYLIHHDGESNFIAELRCYGGNDIVANEIGAVEGSVVARFNEGPCVWQVQADGNWSLKPK